MLRTPLVAAFVFMNGFIKDLHSKVAMDKIKKASKHVPHYYYFVFTNRENRKPSKIIVENNRK